MDRSNLVPRLIAQVVFDRLFAFEPSNACSYPSFESSPRATSTHPSGAERRQLIARCRVLRAEIRDFEEKFESQHLKKPHSSDRGALAPVYDEYRQLKIRVRGNAALHIQAVWRGYLVRKSVIRRPANEVKVVSAAVLDKLSQLKAEKSALKAKLRAFDNKFATEKGRMPTKADKEHLRPQYQRYHELKAMIATLDGAVQGSNGTTDSRSRYHSRGSETGDDDDEGDFRAAEPRFSNMQDTLEHVGLGADLVADDGAGKTEALVKVDASDAMRAAAVPSSLGLDELRTEKRKLQIFLRNYEKDFEEKEGRKVKYVKDISPVLTEYTRYKHIKAVLRELQGGGK